MERNKHDVVITQQYLFIIIGMLQVMLDTAVIMMQQYSAAAALSVPVPENASQSSNSNNHNAPAPPASESQANGNSKTSQSTSSGGDGQFASKTVSSSSEPNHSTSLNNDQHVPNASTSETGITPEEEVRRRRLQKFQQQTE